MVLKPWFGINRQLCNHNVFLNNKSSVTRLNTNLTDAATSYIVNLAIYRENTFMRIVTRRKKLQTHYSGNVI